MASIGTISLTSATDFTASRTFTGTAASDDYIEITGSVAPVFAELYLNSQGSLIYSVVAPSINKTATYTIAWSNPTTAIEGFSRSGTSNEAYNGLSILSPPGSYAQRSEAFTIFGTSGNDVSTAPITSTRASSLQGWGGDDTLIGGDTDNTISPGPGNNQMFGKKGVDIYRTKTSYMANDVITDDGDDPVIDYVQVLLTSKNVWDWSFERIGNDLKGVINDATGSYNFTVKDQYAAPNSWIEGVSLWAMDSTTLWRATTFKAANTSGWTNYADPGTSANDRFTPETLGLGAEKTFYRAWGNDGNDHLTRLADKNIYTLFDGGSGIDTVVYSQKISDYTVNKYPSTSSVEGFSVRNNTAPSTVSADNMNRVERFIFSDKKMAFDINGNAGSVAKVLGAVFGKNTISNKEYVGIGLGLLDSGMSFSALAQLALSASGANDPDSVVERLYANVIGTRPTTTEKAPYVQMLNGGMTGADLVVLAANTSFNQTNIGLTGLATTGIEYQ